MPKTQLMYLGIIFVYKPPWRCNILVPVSHVEGHRSFRMGLDGRVRTY